VGHVIMPKYLVLPDIYFAYISSQWQSASILV